MHQKSGSDLNKANAVWSKPVSERMKIRKC